MRRFLFSGIIFLTLFLTAGVARASEQEEPAAPAAGSTTSSSDDVEELKAEIEALKKKLQEMPDLGEEIKELEKKLESVQKVTAKIDSEEAKLKEEKKERAIAYYRDGFFIETPDKKFRLQITGVLHFDTRIFSGDEQGSPTSFDIRRGRYDFRGNLYRGDIEHQFRLQIEMADTPYLRNAYWMFKFRPELNLQLGQFKTPAGGADWLTEEAQVNFIEYSILPPVTPFFDRGFNLHSFFAGGKIQTCLAIVTGVGTDFDAPQGDYDNHKDYAARVLLVPFKGKKDHPLEGLHAAGSFQQGLASVAAKQGGETGMRTENYESKWYEWKSTALDIEKRTRYGWDLHYIRGPFIVSYEWDRIEWKNVTSYTSGIGNLRGAAHSDAGQIWVSYFPTGEQKTFEDVFFAWRQPKPKKNLSIKEKTWGGWELMGKYAWKNTSKELFDLGILDGSRKGYTVTGGVRWLWDPKVRIMADINYCKSTEGKGIIVQYADKGSASQKRYVEHETALLVRFILTI
ncbi:MAG: porin [Acidobacteriota bacterium]